MGVVERVYPHQVGKMPAQMNTGTKRKNALEMITNLRLAVVVTLSSLADESCIILCILQALVGVKRLCEANWIIESIMTTHDHTNPHTTGLRSRL